MNRFMLVVVCYALLFPFTTSAQTADPKVAELEARVKVLESVDTKRGANVASTLSRAEAIQTEFGTLKGAVDANTHMISQLNNQMQQQYRDLERRVQMLDDQLKLVQNMLKGAGTGGVSAISPKEQEEFLAYQIGVDKFKQKEYLKAAADFRVFINNFPKSKFAANAQYNIGECYFFGRDYEQSIKQFQEFIENYPRHDKIPDALVMQGSAFVELKMNDEAKAFYTKVIRDYPKTIAAKDAKAKIQWLDARGSMTAANSHPKPETVVTGYPSETIEQRRAREKAEQTPAAVPTQAPTPEKPKVAPQNTQPEKRNYMEF
jgi:tol-pal system protein YbgF